MLKYDSLDAKWCKMGDSEWLDHIDKIICVYVFMAQNFNKTRVYVFVAHNFNKNMRLCFC